METREIQQFIGCGWNIKPNQGTKILNPGPQFKYKM